MDRTAFQSTPQSIHTGFGLCPICRGKGVSCERCPDGMTSCENGHNYPHTHRIYEDTDYGSASVKQSINDKHNPSRKHRGDKKPFAKIQPSNPEKRVRPRQEGEGGPRTVAEECLLFLSENIHEECNSITDKFKMFEYKDELRNMINHLLVTNMGGWSKGDDSYIHVSGKVALCEHWDITDDGHLCAKGKGFKQIDSDKLYKFMEACDD